MQDGKDVKKPYAWVRDEEGDEYLCPRDAVPDPDAVNSEDLQDCIAVEPLRKYIEI